MATDQLSSPPTLGATAKEIWDAWKREEYLGGTSCFARAVLEEGLGELVWASSGAGQLALSKVVLEVASARLTQQDEDRVWQALLEGRLQIYRRRNAPSIGATNVTAVLHQATGRSIASGL